MPTRPRSHQLEDISIAEFQRLLPPAWVVRRKEKDYGIDLEVEIFEEDGRPTGLHFLVQVRATDDGRRGDRVSLEVEQLDYFHKLGVPVLVARYLSKPETWHIEWAFNMGFGLPEGQSSFTHRFGAANRWSLETPEKIRRTLEVMRALKRRPPPGRLGIRIDPTGFNPTTRYLVEAAVDDAVGIAEQVLYHSEDADDFAVDIRCHGESLLLELDCVASATFQKAEWTRDELKRGIVYGLILICRVRNLDRVAAALAAASLREKLDPNSRSVAIEAAVSLAPDLEAVVQLALLGRIHEEHDQLYAGFIAFLLRTPSGADARARAIKAFYSAAIQSASRVAPEREGSVRYSLANYLRSTAENNAALREYVQAKRLRPAYLTTNYFLQEVGSCLFNLGRHRCARIAYQRSVDAGCDSQRALLHLADATLFTGDLAQARTIYEQAIEGEDYLARMEATLKMGTCDWLAELVGSQALPMDWRRSQELHQDGGTDPLNLIRTVHGLDRAAHYELGVSKASQKLWLHAIGHFLVAAIADDQDFDAWTNAVICAWNIGQADFIIGVISTAVALAGRAAFDRLRETLAQQHAPAELLAGIDEIFRQVASQVRQAQSNDITLRALRDAHYDVTMFSEHEGQ